MRAKTTKEEKLVNLKARQALTHNALDYHQEEMVRLQKCFREQQILSIKTINKLVRINNQISKLTKEDV